MPRETIMILDNETHSRWTLKALLENERYLVVAVDSIERALRDFSEFRIEGLITEYWVGGASTAEVIREVKTRFPGCYVMMLTDKDLKEKEYEELLGAGVDDFFSKPTSSRKILLHLERGLTRRKDSFVATPMARDNPDFELDREGPCGVGNGLGLQPEGGGQ